MSLIDDIKRDRERPQVRLMSMATWKVKTDEPSPGFVKVVGPSVQVQCPTVATNLNGEDYIARHADARRIARVPQLEALVLAAEEVAEYANEICASGVSPATGGRLILERDVAGLARALTAYRKAKDEAA